MKTKYEILNIDLGNIFSKARKLQILENNLEFQFYDQEIANQIREEILDGEAVEDVLARAEADDRIHWITLLGRRAAADLLTLGKVQPETMLEMSAFSEADFKEIVKIATGTAKRLNNLTIAAEKELNLDTVTNELI